MIKGYSISNVGINLAEVEMTFYLKRAGDLEKVIECVNTLSKSKKVEETEAQKSRKVSKDAELNIIKEKIKEEIMRGGDRISVKYPIWETTIKELTSVGYVVYKDPLYNSDVQYAYLIISWGE